MPESRHEPASDRPDLQHQPRARQAHALNRADAESELVAFSSFVVRDLQKFWAADFQKRAQLLPHGARRVPAAHADHVQTLTGITKQVISPETFTHGMTEQRTRWFKTGFDRGDATACDTFSGDI